MTTNRWVQLAAIALCIGCLLASLLVMKPTIDQQRSDLQLGFARSADEAAPPAVALMTKMLGPFRGFMVNALWYDIEQLKQAGKFAEINEKARLITTMQPRFGEVWRYHAWNLAYNVSVQTYTPDERWDWVNKGIRLLREEGIPWNPRAVKLYREISWIFFHKIGQYSDDMHWYYKRRLCREWQEVLGAITEGVTSEQAADAFRLIVDAPETLPALIEKEPLVRDLLARHLAPAGYNITAGFEDQLAKQREKLLRQLGRITMYAYAARIEETPADVAEQPQYYESSLLPAFKDAALRPALIALTNHLRKRVITDNYKMNPVFMLELMEEFGPVDFRHPATHALYWGYLGTLVMQDRLNKDKVDRINTLRQTIHAPQDLFESGRITFDPYDDSLDVAPDGRMAATYEKALEKAMADLKKAEQGDEKPYETGHENFLITASVANYFDGNLAQSKHYKDKAMGLYGNLEHNVRTGRYLLTQRDFVLLDMKENMENMERVNAYVSGMIGRAVEALVRGRRKEFASIMGAVQDAYDWYQKDQAKTPIAPQHRMELLPIEEIMDLRFSRIMVAPSSLELRGRIWASAPVELRRAAFDRVKPRLYAEAEKEKRDPVKMFPEPEGMAVYREMRGDRLKKLEAQQKRLQELQQLQQGQRTGA